MTVFDLRSLVAVVLLAPALAAAEPSRVSYTRDIRPILSDKCFKCHGPDEKQRRGDLRLDVRDLALRPAQSGEKAVVPREPGKSEMVRRIHSADPDEMMPPRVSKKSLTDAEKQLLRRWIEEGAAYEQHWAFVRPVKPALPAVKKQGWARNGIDQFILARLEKEGLEPSPEADRYTLARRAALDLTGLPPTIAEVDAFVKDTSPNAYEKYVDALLKKPAYGEHWATLWLDLGRYADSNGYAQDGMRNIWPWRDWTIRALNRNLAFDQFTVEQLAGDLLPSPTQDQLVATGFHRNTLTNEEGGTNDEEFRTAAVVDRVNTTFAVWMGLTMACAQCHTHKYDPLTQEEYFKVYAIFNQTADADRGDNSPNLNLLPAADQDKVQQLNARLAELEKQLAQPDPKLDAAQEQWETVVNRTMLPPNVKAILTVEKAKRNEQQKKELSKFYRGTATETKPLRDQIAAVKAEVAKIKPVMTPILRELPPAQRRKTHILIRGNFLDKGAEVRPGVPSVLPSIKARETPGAHPPGSPDRLDFARWLVSEENPLTARVTVNRFWEQVFGRGVVETIEDFGIRGKPPTHPELLDWLALEFSARKWDLKDLLKLMVTSATYRQASRVTPALLERDPENRLLARGPRGRAAAEVIRDQALAIAGLLSPKMYGPSVRPPRPKLGLNSAFGGTTDWDPSPGEDRYRRGLYTVIRRTAPYPSMTTFDAPDRNFCALTRSKTNTPLQALVTLNDPVYVEAAQALARRALKEGGAMLEARLTYAFRLCLARPPRPEELKKLTELHARAKQKFAGDVKAATALATEPLGPAPQGTDMADLAAWTVVSNVLLNLDETLARR
jgi:hypothetical protein